MSQPTHPTPLAAPVPDLPRTGPASAGPPGPASPPAVPAPPAPPCWGPSALPLPAVPAAQPTPARPARRRRLLLAAAVLVILGPGAVGVRLALDVGSDTAVATAAEAAAPIAGGLTPSVGVPSAGAPAGLPPSAVPPPSAVLPPATEQPVGLGGDPALDGAAEGCFTGVMSDCVELYLSSYRDPALQRYTSYGDTCAGRQPAGTLRSCTASFPR